MTIKLGDSGFCVGDIVVLKTPFVTGGDPDFETSLEIVSKLPGAGADVIELGIPFSDPMADGPTNQASYLRALKAGMTLVRLLDLVRKFRKADKATPVVLMGAYNPIHAYGTARFMKDAAETGVDGLLIVDVPPEEDEVLRLPAAAHGIDIVRFLAPTTDAARLKVVLDGATGYLYYASIAGITGTKSYDEDAVRRALADIHAATKLPCVVGFRNQDAGTGGRHRAFCRWGRGRLRDCGENRVARGPGYETCRFGGRCDRFLRRPGEFRACGG
ncbi:MAG: tryptophan synthase subunit alpha [Rhizomicrobium sp.]